MKTVLGIDLGTQSVKVVFYDFAARRSAAVASAPLELDQDDTGKAEQQARWWIDALANALGKVDAAVRKSAQAIAVSGQQHGFVPLDQADKVLAPVKLWCDTSTAREAEEIMAAFGGREACIEKVGNPIATGYTASKIRWLKKHNPDAYDDLDCILLPHDYLNLYLAGERCMEMGDASGTGFLDVRKRAWSGAMLEAIDSDRDLAACLPALRIDNEPIGTLRSDVADELGLPAGIEIGIGGGDNMMGAIGTGNVRAGSVTMSLGTSGTVYAFADEPIIDPHGDIAAFCSSTGGWLPLLCTMNCTVSTELMRGLLGADIAAFETQIASALRGADGVITLPFFNGERTPNLPDARGCIVGLNSRNARPDNLLRSAVEGATFALKFGIDELAALGVETREIVVTGGGAKSATWRQVVADICNAPVVVLSGPTGTITRIISAPWERSLRCTLNETN
ncbi:MAG: xylulokinase [Woeseiaceae bacterium]